MKILITYNIAAEDNDEEAVKERAIPGSRRSVPSSIKIDVVLDHEVAYCFLRARAGHSSRVQARGHPLCIHELDAPPPGHTQHICCQNGANPQVMATWASSSARARGVKRVAQAVGQALVQSLGSCPQNIAIGSQQRIAASTDAICACTRTTRWVPRAL
eukprot:CAMPEP_0185557882 /NCGR_PEP_ID=MMETSP1381-20130426/50863_1 /TAXON_ID=298111 /ORGANISM="Pavlova sp., Strain CCMP459" /LENGTH=158 /DNA_ID=CAMNT_0028171385 /DNA_START=101 /DNA_END=575 /DNA_ORIENTATION=+